MNRTGSNLLFLALGAALGAAAGYIAASDKKEEWLNEINNLVDRVKVNVKDAVNKGKEQFDDMKGEAYRRKAEFEDLKDDVKDQVKSDAKDLKETVKRNAQS